MTQDTLVAIILSVIGASLTALGLYASVSPLDPKDSTPKSRRKRWIIWSLMVLFAISGMGISFWQSNQNTRQQALSEANSTRLQESLDKANGEITSAHSDLHHIQTSQDQLIGSLNGVISYIEHSADTKTVSKAGVVQALKSAVTTAKATSSEPAIPAQTKDLQKLTDDELASNAGAAAAKLLNLCAEERTKITPMDPKNQDLVAHEFQSGEIQDALRLVSEYQGQILSRAHYPPDFARRGIRGNSEMGEGAGFGAIVLAEQSARDLQTLLTSWRTRGQQPTTH